MAVKKSWQKKTLNQKSVLKNNLIMTNEEFEKLVSELIKLIPVHILEKMDNVDICVEDEPNEANYRKTRTRKESLILGLYEGVPKTKRWGYGFVLPDKITIFKNPILAIARNSDEIKEIVKNTVWHEIANHFGFDETGVRNLAVERKNRKRK